MPATTTTTKSGIPGVGDVAWGAHLCHFYDGRDDLAGLLVPFFRAGLESDEACLWVTADPFGASEARAALGAAVPDLAERESAGQIEILDFAAWYRRAGSVDATGIADAWLAREADALAHGWRGLRLTGNTSWVGPGDWNAFLDYERLVDATFVGRRIVGLCSYARPRWTEKQVGAVVRAHRLPLTRQRDHWTVSGGAHGDAGLWRARARRYEALLARLAHELRNPLSPILTALQLVRLDERDDPFAAEHEIIERQAGRICELADQVHDVAHLACGRLRLSRSEIELGDVVDDAVERVRPDVQQRRQRVRIDVARSGLRLRGDRRRLAQVVTALLSNASQYAPQGTAITVSAEAVGDCIALRVRDEGKGIPQELRSTLFDLHAEGEPTPGCRARGLGLGLPIAREIVARHRGTIEVTSAPGEGCEITVELPRHGRRRSADRTG